MRDATGAIIAGNSVTVSNEKPGILMETVTDYSGFNQFLERPNYVCSGALQIKRDNRLNPFNTACFPPAHGGQTGTTPRNACYDPGLVNFDGRLAKRFKITERVGFAFRADFFNALNYTNFAMASGNPITSTAPSAKSAEPQGFPAATTAGPVLFRYRRETPSRSSSQIRSKNRA